MMSSQLERPNHLCQLSYHPQVKSLFSPVTEYSVSITEYSVSVKVKYDNPDVLCISERDNGKAISITLYYICWYILGIGSVWRLLLLYLAQ